MTRKNMSFLIFLIAFLAMASLLEAGNPFSDEKPLSIDKAAAVKKSYSSKESLSGANSSAEINYLKKLAGYYRPVGEWTGKLFLPKKNKRDKAGGVVIRLENCPEPSLIGKLVWVRWDTREPVEKWFYAHRYDVNIDPERLKKALEDGLNPPVVLDGWKKVSLLESLAGGRPGDITVMLKNPEWTGKVLLIKEEPVQICGNSMALVRFLGPAGEDRQTVVHYDPGRGDFVGPKEVVSIPTKYFSRSNTPVPRSSTVDIEKDQLNKDGWYIYGRRLGNRFDVEAIEPRAAFSFKSDISVSGQNEVKRYISKDHFDNLKPGLLQRTELLPGESYNWKEGDKGLLIHLFGWREHPDEEAGPSMMGLVTGHLSFGFGTVVRCPFTGDLRWDFEYRQVYAHNREGLVGGSMKWHNYSGSLRRGWMYTIPISDSVIRVPELEPYDFNGWKINPWQGLSRQFEKMHALYRTGAGAGISSVKPNISCVQDSHAALYSALVTFQETIAKTGKVKEWIEGEGRDSDEVKRYLRLLLLVRDIKKSITTFGLAQGAWRDFVNKPLATRDPNAVVSVINALMARKTIFPRKGNDNLMRLAADKGYPMWSVLTCQIGGLIPGLKPQAPTSPTAR